MASAFRFSIVFFFNFFSFSLSAEVHFHRRTFLLLRCHFLFKKNQKTLVAKDRNWNTISDFKKMTFFDVFFILVSAEDLN